MKRAKQLQPLSRQHHLGLHVGRHAKECADNPQQVTEHWQALSSYMSDMHDHFQIEDNLIVNALRPHQSNQPEVASVLGKLEQQHKRLHKLTAEIQATQDSKKGHATDNISIKDQVAIDQVAIEKITVEQVRELANLLYDHIRFEERELLPMVEKYLTEDELNAVYDASPDDIKHLDEQR
ncbi:hemerythrin-like domain-containing protein [Psychrobacter sp. PL15]|jgi:hemerythrin-like domain-containing protein|uniref:hemerythrin domain-containing protein n=1 Tax=Psychrobacter sp. PL15 TaxID=3071719 RepID=UPI002E004614|nr:hemerythrin-like domain-containing protein [Psychrobacter sp. PL15]